MSVAPCVFHLFPKLPVELQDEIWGYCLPHRVCEQDVPVANIVYFSFTDEDVSPCTLGDTSLRNAVPPLITRVCRESRSVALKVSGPAVFPAGDCPEETPWFAGTSMPHEWQMRTSIQHLNWTSVYNADYQSYGSPLHTLAWEAARTSGVASLMEEFIDRDYRYPFWGPMKPTFRHDRAGDLEALQQLPNWLVVMQIIIIHSDFEPAAETGMFGLLGDAPVQIVDVAEEARINAFYHMAESCDRKAPVRIDQDFNRESVESMKQRLRERILDAYDSEKLVAAMRPAIMFRLCTQKCNTPEEAVERKCGERGTRGRGRGRGRGS